MSMEPRKAKGIWKGTLLEGRGTVDAGSSAFTDLPYTWKSRTEDADGLTSPEEMLAAAHAQCFAMSVAHTLKTAYGLEPVRVTVEARCTLEQQGGGFRITRMELQARGLVPGMDAARFAEALRKADETCPVSNALRSGMAVQVTGDLEPER